ncbi:MAG: Trk system potassium transporter TrkA [Eubacteriales bacterium]|nr:Trk system potassium transporter TrkA [Eubacteriales bacterium]
MNVIIVGCGKVGSELASTLISEGNSVAMIDNSVKALNQVAEELDVLTIVGDGSDINILKEAGIEAANIFIAVTPHDEVNLLSCLIAKQVSNVETIARVRNPIYYREKDFLRKKFGISKIINPEQKTASNIYKLLCYPGLSRVDRLENGNVIIFTLHCRGEYGFAGNTLMDVRRHTKTKVLACAVYRKGNVYIPDGSFLVEKDDEITFVTTGDDLSTFLKEHNIVNIPADDVLITGGGTISYYLTEKLIDNGKNVRIIEMNEDRCEYLSEVFPKAEIIHGDGTDRRFLIKQGLENAGAFVALTGIDEENIVTANFAKDLAGIKVITKVNRNDLRDVIEQLDIDSAVFPKMITADVIAQYVRAKASGAGSDLQAFFRYMDNRVEIVEFKAREGEPFMDTPLMKLELKKDLILACIIRNGKTIIPNGGDSIHDGDSVIVVTSHKGITSMADLGK